jgi:hypothetical protein
VGSNGETLVADSAAATGLSYQGNFAAGKSKIINGDFGINQRAFTITTTNDAYTFDRWIAGFAALILMLSFYIRCLKSELIGLLMFSSWFLEEPWGLP